MVYEEPNLLNLSFLRAKTRPKWMLNFNIEKVTICWLKLALV